MKKNISNNFSIDAKLIFLIFLTISILLAIYRPLIEWSGYSGFLDKPLSTLEFHPINYQANTTPPTIQTPFTDADQKTVITFRFKANAINTQETLFQTAPVDGLRITLQHLAVPAENPLLRYISIKNKAFLGNTLTLEAGAKADKPPFSLIIDNNISTNVWHDLTLVAWNKHFVNIALDGVDITRLKTTALNYNLSNMTIGGGHNNHFDGDISDFSLKNTIFDLKHRNTIKHITNIALAISLASCLIAFLFLSKRSLTRTTKLNYLAFGVLIGFFIAVIFHYISSFYLNEAYPQNTFLYYGLGEEFKDFYDNIRINALFDPYFTQYLYILGYPPFIFALIRPLSFLNIHAALLIYYLIFFSIYLVIIKHYFSYDLTRPAKNINNAMVIFILGFMTYPLLFSFERGNIELYLFLFLTGFIYFYQKNKLYTAVPFLVAAIAMKLYPVVFLVLLFSDKHYKAIMITLFGVFLLETLSFACFKHGMLASFQQFTHTISHISNLCEFKQCTRYTVGLWGSLKTLTDNVGFMHTLPINNFKYFSIATIIGFALIAAYVAFIEKDLWKKVALLSFSMLLFPVMSNDYKLMHIYLPLFLFLMAKPRKYDLLYATLFLALLIPKNYAILSTDNVGISSVLNPALMILMSIIIIISGLHNSYKKFQMRRRINAATLADISPKTTELLASHSRD